MNIQDILSREEQFRYQMLGRMQSDCEYYIATGMRTTRNLWAGTPELQIEYMKKIWKSFDSDKKPEWLKYGQIIKYEKQMIPQRKK